MNHTTRAEDPPSTSDASSTDSHATQLIDLISSTTDLPCFKCGYSLRGLSLDDGKCPECGTPCADSSRQYTDENRSWKIRNLSRGAGIIMIGLSLSLLVSVLQWIIVSFYRGGVSVLNPVIAFLFANQLPSILVAVILLAGVWRLTCVPPLALRIEDPQSISHRQPGVRRAARWLLICTVAMHYGYPLLDNWFIRRLWQYSSAGQTNILTGLNAFNNVLPVVESIATACGVICFIIYLRRSTRALDLSTASSWTTVVLWLAVFYFGYKHVVWFSIGVPMPGTGRPILNTQAWPELWQALAYLVFIVNLGAQALCIWVMWSLRDYARRTSG